MIKSRLVLQAKLSRGAGIGEGEGAPVCCVRRIALLGAPSCGALRLHRLTALLILPHDCAASA